MPLLLIILSVVAIIGCLLPFWEHKHWLVRVHNYFARFYNILALTCLVSIIIITPVSLMHVLLVSLLLISMIYNTYKVFPYTPLAHKKIKDAPTEHEQEGISFFIFNVYQYNANYAELTEWLAKEKPDILFLLETDKKWAANLAPLSDQYVHQVHEIRSDTYGMMLFSRIPIAKSQTHYLVEDDVPSMELEISLGDKNLLVWGLHPKPPVPGEALSSKSKDRELIMVAHRMLNHTTPFQVLIGDLNDVGWSQTSRKFRKISGLKDPRTGRGSFGTFPAYSQFKFPLDHIFCSPTFALKSFEILPSMGSDHHPVFVKLVPDIPGNQG